MKKVKITVLKTTLDKELAQEYGIEGLTACPMLKAGDVFYADYAKPEGLCDEAWKAIYQYVFALAHGADKELFYYGDWIKKPGIAICSCKMCIRDSFNSLSRKSNNAFDQVRAFIQLIRSFKNHDIAPLWFITKGISQAPHQNPIANFYSWIHRAGRNYPAIDQK